MTFTKSMQNLKIEKQTHSAMYQRRKMSETKSVMQTDSTT
jgi:hypothetical protein